MAKVALSSSSIPAALFPNGFPASYEPPFQAPKKIIQRSKIHAKLGGGDGETKRADKKKFITKEEEPEQRERRGESHEDPPYIIIFGMSIPFIILAVGFANGWIKVPVR